VKLNVDLFTSTVVVELVYVAVHFIMMIPVTPRTQHPCELHTLYFRYGAMIVIFTALTFVTA
jgi:hypothetical protein